MEYLKENEVLYNYILEQYSPLKDTKNKLRISNILFYSFAKYSEEKAFMKIVNDFRENLGLNQTVWGIKKIDDKISWEFYFYRYYNNNNNSKINLDNLIKIFNKYFKVADLNIDETLPYTMLSFDIDRNLKIDNTHIYFDKRFSKNFQAWSYQLSSKDIEFENHYECMNSKNYKEITSKILNSPFVTSQIDILKILMPYLTESDSICIASKRDVNGIYFQGLPIDLFIHFLKNFNYPKDLITFVTTNKNLLDYIRYDISFDYAIRDSKLFIKKSGFYGTF